MDRRRLPETRQAKTHKFTVGGVRGYLIVGLFEDGQPGEIFVRIDKEGSTVAGLLDGICLLTSMSLQRGVPLVDIIRKFAGQRFEPSGPTKNPNLPMASSIPDYLFRWIGEEFKIKWKKDQE